MAVLAEAISVIIKAGSIRAKLPGGWDAFIRHIRNETFCTDGELVRVGFMSPDEVKGFVAELEGFGLCYLDEGQAIDMMVTDQQRGMAAESDWATFWIGPWEEDATKEVAFVMLKDTTSYEFVTPDDWTYEGSLFEQFAFAETGRTSEYLDYIRTENGIDIFRDLRTGKVVYAPANKEREDSKAR